MKTPIEQKPKFNDLADAGSVKAMLVILWPLMVAIGSYWYCESREANCQDRKEAAHEAKSKANNPDDLAVFYKTYSKDAEQKSVEGNTPIKCSIPCHIVNKALDDPVGLFTGFLVYVVYLQILLMFRQETWLRGSFKAADASARAAMEGVITAQDTAQRQLRAYVHVAAGDINFPSPGFPEAEIVIKNSGQTPAYHVRHWIHMWIAEHPLKVTLPIPSHDFQMATDVLAPGAMSIMPIEKGGGPVPVESIRLLGTAEGTIYIYGMITYKDVFGIERYTKYRLMYGGQGPVAPGKLKPDSDGNEAT